jgi:hypothetical protein
MNNKKKLNKKIAVMTTTSVGSICIMIFPSLRFVNYGKKGGPDSMFAFTNITTIRM